MGGGFISGAVLAVQHQIGDGAIGELLQDPTARRRVTHSPPDGFFPPFDEARKTAKPGGQQPFQALADAAGENGGAAAGADGNQNRVAVHNRGHEEAGEGGLIDDVHRHADILGAAGDFPVLIVVAGCGENHSLIADIIQAEGAAQQNDLVGHGGGFDFCRRVLRHDRNARAGAFQQAQLLRCRFTAADNQGFALVQRQENRQAVHRPFPFLQSRAGIAN